MVLSDIKLIVWHLGFPISKDFYMAYSWKPLWYVNSLNTSKILSVTTVLGISSGIFQINHINLNFAVKETDIFHKTNNLSQKDPSESFQKTRQEK